MVTSAQGLALEPLLGAAVTLAMAGLALYNVLKPAHVPTIPVSPMSVRDMEYRHQVYCALLETVRQLRIALDARHDIRYIDRLDKQLLTLVKLWNDTEGSHEEA